VTHFVSLVAVLAAEITCLCHGGSSTPKGRVVSTGAPMPQICGVAGAGDQRYNQRGCARRGSSLVCWHSGAS
jgi:hypothetical protein